LSIDENGLNRSAGDSSYLWVISRAFAEEVTKILGEKFFLMNLANFSNSYEAKSISINYF
jgi:hypothetical protein